MDVNQDRFGHLWTCFKAQDQERLSQIDLEAFQGKLLEFFDIRLIGSPKLIDRFWQRLSITALVLGDAVPSQFPVSCLMVLNHKFSIFKVSLCVFSEFLALLLFLITLDES